MAPPSQQLPIDPHLPAIVQALESHGRLVILAPPGAGKTTRVPVALLEREPAQSRTVLVVQPRRVAARLAACRVAEELHSELGNRVGYHVRYDRKRCASTRLLFVTEGILLQQLQRDPFLDGVSAVILDEFHERSIDLDLLLGLLVDVRQSARPDLQLVVMSATLAPEPIAAYLGGAPIVRAEGRQWPLTTHHEPRDRLLPISDHVAASIRRWFPEHQGNQLVFLPGMQEIRKVAQRLNRWAQSSDVDVQILHGSLPLEQQQRVLQPSGRRKILLSTNVAETSLTVDGVDLVIDSGEERQVRFDSRRGLERLEHVWISQQSADQRAGRAGRQGPGVAVRLWSRAEEASLPPQAVPEIRRTELSQLFLQLLHWGTHPADFRFFDSPPSDHLAAAQQLLRELGAVTPEDSLTKLGREMAVLPVIPRHARLLLAGRDAGFLDDAALFVALLEERDILRPQRDDPGTRGPCDLLRRRDLCQSSQSRLASHVSETALRQVQRLKKELVRRTVAAAAAPASETGEGERETSLRRLLLQAFPDRVARARPGTSQARMVGGRGLKLARSSSVHDAPFWIAIRLQDGARGEQSEAWVSVATSIEPEWLRQLFPDSIRVTDSAQYDAKRERVIAQRTESYHDLALSSQSRKPTAEEVRRHLGPVLSESLDAVLEKQPKARQWIERIRFLQRHLPEVDLPDTGNQELTAFLLSIHPHVVGLTEFRKLSLEQSVGSILSFAQRKELDRLAPESWTTPQGTRVRLQYSAEGPPILPVKIQQMFGVKETPRVARGKVPVLLHLLAPNHRPAQITQDLESFWKNTYQQVRKDLRGRYPKHAWPENPH